ncbi:MAG: hypothetical protein JGK17_08950 [Microcoleus sp. PH2017_10_PVI_O_A]|uniref:hypothetical protein n=1 Tax=unclassified Microcoleus TaxID=2642155 RepID=UPI001D744DFC|nr:MULTISPECIES: hypothetical protein [unclassified Microcoleus]TAE83954.1 MAG: hypothetical protein EAZ83_07880 [Oscillatoriales cyanobacterium]MCC3405706.1 hypothetical protein [Microcoleus sp. PH2017_10_PVI_O_A]MCC3460862.1 hypothetical protein [Microcoleus sp. PH2017_11_PCY_U_A]MCC3478171.1 hypothetical protein [Microcoleus sp. PH2017_12_PCY_D_A]MCC3527362.1 hypothetical protein [Microcoleus sp. PH2017_21_RUC_O_A]
MCKLAIDKTWIASLLAVTLAVAGNSFWLFTQNASLAVSIAQTNEPERVPDGKMVPVNGKANVRLTNKTNDRLFYQVVGQTNRRSLAENTTVALQALTLPASILFRRQDGALLKVNLKPVGEGTVEVRLDETNDLGLDRKSLSIRKDGTLFLR